MLRSLASRGQKGCDYDAALKFNAAFAFQGQLPNAGDPLALEEAAEVSLASVLGPQPSWTRGPAEIPVHGSGS